MSNNRDNYWDDENEDEDDTQVYGSEDDSQLVKKLRRDIRVLSKENKQYKDQVNDLTKAQKERILKEVLTERGVNPKIANLIPSDIETTADAINAFIDANADVFNIDVTTKQTNVNQQDVDNLKKMDQVTTGAESSDSTGGLEARIAAAKTEEELMSILSGL